MLTHLYQILLQRAEQLPHDVAIGGQQGLGWRPLTGTQLLELTETLSEDLAERGVRVGDRVVLWTPNHWRSPVYLFALWKLGAVAVPFDREMNPEAAARIIEAVEPRLVLAGYGERPAWAGDAVEWWEPRAGTEVSSSGFRVSSGGGNPKPETRNPTEELAAIFFTSGTTGSPKGCMITHGNLCSQVDAIQHTVALDTTCRLVSVLPLSHLFELTVGLLYPLSRGAAVHYAPSRRGPDILRVMNEQQISHIIAVPQLLTLMGSTLDERVRGKLPGPVYHAMHAFAPRLPMGVRRLLFRPVHQALGGHLRMMASGGAALPAETQLLWQRMGVRILEGYGSSECSPVIACGSSDGSTPVGSVGRPLRGVEVRFSDEAELQVRGPNVMKGYWKDPERTAEVLQDGWYATGDMASQDDAGNIRILGRVKDLIVLPSGLKIWPQDVEEVLREHPAVKDAAVIPVPGATGGATLHAYLIPSAPGPISVGQVSNLSQQDGILLHRFPAGLLEGVVAHCNGRLAVHQRVATASLWPDADFPRTSTLKVRRNLLPLPEQWASTAVHAALASDDPVSQAVAGAARVAAVTADQTLAGLGLDSLGIVELSLALEEKTGRRVDEGDLRMDMTVAEVKGLLSRAAPVDGEAKEEGAGVWRSPPPLWAYTWGRVFRGLALPVDLMYRRIVTRTVVLGGGHLRELPPRVVLAGPHRGFPDMPLIRHGLARTPARRLANRLAIAAGAEGFGNAGLFAWYAILAFGLFPLRQFREREASLRALLRVAEAGNAVLIFPQGSHVHPEAERAGEPAARFRTGAAHLAIALNAAVVPFGIAGTEAMMPTDPHTYTGFKLGGVPMSFKPGPLAIAFGPPLVPVEGETADDFTQRLQEACFALSREAEAALG